MQERLPKKVYKNLKKTIEEGKELDLETADVIAHEMKEWAIEKGATHYTHWFQPLTGVTAEKHDAFISAPHAERQGADGVFRKRTDQRANRMHLPSRREDLRATFEARGYTAWDCTSPAFVETGCGRSDTLYSDCILFLYRRSTGSEDTAAAFHGGNQQAGTATSPPVWKYDIQAR